MPVAVFELKCKLQEYPTGKTGLEGLAAQLANKSQSHEFELDEKVCWLPGDTRSRENDH